MTERETITGDAEVLRGMVGRIRRRWRQRYLLEALALALGSALLIAWLAVLARSAGLWTSPPAWARWIAFALLFPLPVLRLVRVLRRGPDDRRIALYIEEREPGLDEAVVSAVEQLDGPAPDASPSLAARVVSRARGALEARERGDRIERPLLRRAGVAAGSLALVAVLLAILGPLGFRDAARGMVTPWVGPPPEPVRALAVKPGNVEVPKGGALEILAEGQGFVAGSAELVTRADSGGEWQRIPMGRDTLPEGAFAARLFDLTAPATYYVEADGVRSPTFRITVVDLPTVGRLVLDVSPPAYTGQAAEHYDPGGDVAALAGSRLSVRARATRPVKGATLVLDGGTRIPMESRAGGELVASLVVRADGFYHVELEAEDGRRLRGSLSYAIDALEDEPPTVRFTTPGRDTRPTAVEEVSTEAEAQDDYGVRRLELRYVVNGGPEQRIVLADSTMRALRTVSATHTFFLEELSLKPGDAVSYHARADDALGQTGTSDVYFLEIRPFDRVYRQSEQGGGGGGGGGQGGGEGLSARQREIVVGAFNVVRDSARGPLDDWREGIATLAIGEGRLREEVAGLSQRLATRGLAAGDSTFSLIRSELDSAVTAMRATEGELGRQSPREALPPAQKALSHLQRAEAAYREVQVQFGGGGGGGGGGDRSRAEELADLFELETDRLQNQYETVRRQSESEAQRELDETVERLRRLATRQQQENERMQRMADALGQRGGAASGAGGSQRQLAQEAEEAARRLERLSRERSSPALADAARRLREAAEAMRRAASAGGESGTTAGASALDRLRSATRELESSRASGVREEVQELVGRSERLRDRQREAGERATELAGGGATPEQIEEVGTRAQTLAGEAERLESDLDRLARGARRDQPRAAARLDDAARGLREGRARDRILASRELVRRGSPQGLIAPFEERTARILDSVAARIREAAGSLETPQGDRAARALEETRELVRGLESLRERTRALGQGGREQGTGSEQGQQGQQQGQGQQGQQSQGQGQGQQGQGQGQQGQGQQGQQGQGQGGQGEGRGEGRQAQEGQGGRGGQNPGGAQNQGGGLGAGNERVSEGSARGGTPGGSQGARQLARELRLRRQAAESLRSEVRALGQDTRDLDRVVDQLRALERSGRFGDPQGLAILEEELIARLKEFEFTLWRALDPAAGSGPALGAGARVPPEYRELVEEYYRALARQGGSSPPRSPPPPR